MWDNIPAMKVFFTADIHYDLLDNPQKALDPMLNALLTSKADVFAIGGDTIGLRKYKLWECLRFFEKFKGHKVITAGNHDLWVNPGSDSFKYYEEEFRNEVETYGFHYLDHAPFVADGVGFVGSVGWYDYSFRDPLLKVPMERYYKKLLPGECEWMDRHHVNWNFDDPGFTDHVIEKLKDHLTIAGVSSEVIICIIHHLPFENLLTRKSDRSWTFGNAFMGSRRLGEVMQSFPKVRYALCGHSHVRVLAVNGRIACVNVGSTYTEKRWEVVDVKTAK